MSQSGSSIVQQVDIVLLYIIGMGFILLFGVTFTMIYFVIRYHRGKHPQADTTIRDNPILEIIWTVIPTLLVLSMFFVGLKGFKYIRQVPENPSLTINVIAQMWEWTFEYENKKKTKVLFMPKGEDVKFVIHSNDVIHSFYIPAFRIKQDAVPGMDNFLWFNASEEGIYDVFCAEYCGLQHSSMVTKVEVMGKDKFYEWYHTEVPESTGELIITPMKEETVIQH